MSDGAYSEGICGVFRPRIPLTDLSDLDGDALVGDDWLPEVEAFVDVLTFLRAGFKFSLVLAIATGVGIRLLSSTFRSLGIDVGVVGAVLIGAHWRVGGVEGSGGC